MLASQPQRVRLTSSGRLRRERQRKRRVVRSVNSAQIRGPIVHQPPPTLEQIRPRVGRLGLVADHVRKRRLDHLPRVVGLLGRPVAETRPEAVPGQTCSGASGRRSSSPATSRPAMTSLTPRSHRRRTDEPSRDRRHRRLCLVCPPRTAESGRRVAVLRSPAETGHSTGA